jgi:DNA-binding XRE family transcriptional regulator
MPKTKKRKTGPRGGLYSRLYGDTSAPPSPKKSWRKLSPLQQSRLLAGRALWRKRKFKEKYRKIADLVRSVRSSMGMNHSQFAEELGVSLSSVKRWEYCSGREPKIETMNKIRILASKCIGGNYGNARSAAVSRPGRG